MTLVEVVGIPSLEEHNFSMYPVIHVHVYIQLHSLKPTFGPKNDRNTFFIPCRQYK